jgi:hypothetical protein
MQGSVLYDSHPGAADASSESTSLDGGNVTVHGR